MLGRMILVLFSLLMLAGCNTYERADRLQDVDAEIQMDLFDRYKKTEALSFFKKGGIYIDEDEGLPLKDSFDRSNVVPFLKTMSDKHGLKWEAFYSQQDPTGAMGIVAALPPDKESRVAIFKSIDEVQNTFPGAILQTHGHKWLSIDFLTKEMNDLLEDETLTREQIGEKLSGGKSAGTPAPKLKKK